jgi:hypothetical protein
LDRHTDRIFFRKKRSDSIEKKHIGINNGGMMRSSVLFVFFFAAIFQLSFSQTNDPSGQNRRKVDQGTILFLFQNHIYKSLSEKLEEMQRAYQHDIMEESL